MKNPHTNGKQVICTYSLIFFFFLPFNGYAQDQWAWYDFDALTEALELQPGDWMADIGTNDGFYLNRFLPVLGETGHIFAVDVSTRGLGRLHENIKQWQYFNISPVSSIETNPLLPAGSLDAILIRNAYHEFSEPKQMLIHLKRALKPGGRLVISEPMEENHQNHDRATQENDHVLDIEFVIRDLEEIGYTVVKIVRDFAQQPRPQDVFYWLLVATPSGN